MLPDTDLPNVSLLKYRIYLAHYSPPDHYSPAVPGANHNSLKEAQHPRDDSEVPLHDNAESMLSNA